MAITKKLLVLWICTALLLILPSVTAQEVTEIGTPLAGQNAIEYVAQIDQELFTATFMGYLTYIEGLPLEATFSEETSLLMRTEATARFLVSGAAEVKARSVHNNMFTTISEVEINFYYSETPAGGSFDTPESFTQGELIASYTVRFQSIINVQEPNVGVLMMYGDSTQTFAAPFTLAGQSYQLGHEGLITRFNNFGQGLRASEEPLLAQYFLVGHMNVLAQE